jgi:hypothetical protein
MEGCALMTDVHPLQGRPSRKYLSTLRKAKKVDYSKFEKACLDAYLLGQTHVIVAVPYVAKFPKNFPQRRFMKAEGTTYFYKINASRLLKWLYDKGYTELTGQKIGWAIQSYNQQMKELLDELQ